MWRTPWKVKTTEEQSGGAFVAFASGKIHLIHEDTGELMIISYRSMSIEVGKGPPIGYSESTTSDPSGGLIMWRWLKAGILVNFLFPAADT